MANGILVGDVLSSIEGIISALSDGQTLWEELKKSRYKKLLSKQFVYISEKVFEDYDESKWINFQKDNYIFLSDLFLKTPACPSYLHIVRKSIAEKGDNRISDREINELITAYYDIMKDSEYFRTYVIKLYDIVHEKYNDDPIFSCSSNEIGLDIVKKYSQDFERVMFLQGKDEVQITLKDLYVENDYSSEGPMIHNHLGNKTASDDITRNLRSLVQYIYSLLDSDEHKMIIKIEGDAGVGKTSLVSKLAYDYTHRMINRKLVWEGKKLLIVKLRELNSSNENFSKINNLWKSVIDYLLKDSIDKIEEHLVDSIFDNAVLVLDGFDELCMQNDMKHGDIYSVAQGINAINADCKVIITSRPNYLTFDQLNYRFVIKECKWQFNTIRLKQFSRYKREEWIDVAEKKGFVIDSCIKNFLIGEMREDVQAVASTPFTMYLIAHEKIDIEADGNLWSIYDRIFNRELIERPYERDNYKLPIRHPLAVDGKLINSVIKAIAYKMYVNKRLFLSENEVQSCIKSCLEDVNDNNTQEIFDRLKESYALYSYFRDDGMGSVYFYHNYIQEFYLAEKLCDVLDATLDSNATIENADERLKSEPMMMNALPSKVFEFLKSKVIDHRNNNISVLWVEHEKENHVIGRLFIQYFYNTIPNEQIEYVNHLFELEKIVFMNYDNVNDIMHMPSVAEIKDKDEWYPVVNSLLDDESKIKKLEGVLAPEYAMNVMGYLEKNNGSIDSYDLGRMIPIDFQKLNLLNVDKVAFELINMPGMLAMNTCISSSVFSMDNARGSRIHLSDMILCNFFYVSFAGSWMMASRFEKCSFENVKFSGSDMFQVTFKECKFKNVPFDGTIIKNSCFINCEFEGISFEGTQFIDCGIVNGNGTENQYEMFINILNEQQIKCVQQFFSEDECIDAVSPIKAYKY